MLKANPPSIYRPLHTRSNLILVYTVIVAMCRIIIRSESRAEDITECPAYQGHFVSLIATAALKAKWYMTFVYIDQHTKSSVTYRLWTIIRLL